MEENNISVPEGWLEIEKFGAIGVIINGLSGKKGEDFGFGSFYIPYINVFKNSKINPNELSLVNIRKGEKQNKIIYGDIIFTTSSETIEEVGMTSIFLEKNSSFYLNSFCFGFRLNSFEILIPEFARYLFRSNSVRHKISLLGQGSTRYNLSKTRLLKDLKLIIPIDLEEQSKIAKILSKVDKAITETKDIIAKYNCIKNGLMQDLLTKGIDENGNIRSQETHDFKDSLLGKIPKEWSIKNLGELIIAIDPQPDHRTPPQLENGVPYLGISDFLGNGDIDIVNCRKVGRNVLIKQMNAFSVDAGDMIFGKIGTIGKPKKLPNFYKSQFTLSANVILIKPLECPDFVYWSLISDYISNQVSLAIHSTSQPAFGMEKIRALNIITPHPTERKLITEKLKAFENISFEEERKLLKLKSIKTGLMQDLLSGKKRVTTLINQSC